MHYIIYKITNNINERYYIGRHATSNMDDGYMGSGKAIKNALSKYGVENFTKEIIATAETAEKLWELEKYIVNETIVKDPLSYNMCYGGKHYLDGLKKYNNELFKEHQRMAGIKGGKSWVASNPNVKEWHAKGGSASSRKRSMQYTYRITTNENEKFTVNGLEFKELCKEKNWNYNTLHWKKSFGKTISRGQFKGFLVEQLNVINRII